MTNTFDQKKLDEAVAYATKMHEGIKRKGTDIPYIVHPLEAMAIVETISHDIELMAAAVLHDVIEDTDATYDDIKERFGKRVADIVLSESTTEIPNYKKMTWVESRQKAIDLLKMAPIDVKIVALGDKLSNMRAIHTDFKKLGDSFWQRFRVKDPKIHKWRYYELLNCFEGLENTNAYKEFKKLVIDTFNGV